MLRRLRLLNVTSPNSGVLKTSSGKSISTTAIHWVYAGFATRVTTMSMDRGRNALSKHSRRRMASALGKDRKRRSSKSSWTARRRRVRPWLRPSPRRDARRGIAQRRRAGQISSTRLRCVSPHRLLRQQASQRRVLPSRLLLRRMCREQQTNPRRRVCGLPNLPPYLWRWRP